MTMINTNGTTAPRARFTPATPRISTLARLARFHTVWRQRQKLKTLDAAALSDIGLTRTQADAEAKRSFWDAPATWTR